MWCYSHRSRVTIVVTIGLQLLQTVDRKFSHCQRKAVLQSEDFICVFLFQTRNSLANNNATVTINMI